MTCRRPWRYALPLGLVFAAMATNTEAQTERSYRTLSTSRQFVDESDVTLRVRFALGNFHLGLDQGGALYRSQLVYDEELFEPVQRYDRDSRTFHIEIENEGSRRVNVNVRDLRDLRQRLDVTLSPAVPARVDLEFGVVRADLDLGGLALIEALVKSGASETTLRFSRPTTRPCERLQVKTGAAEFRVQGLGNSNCATMEFEAAAGIFVLDFTGEWQHNGETDAKVKLGVGALTLRFPESLGVALSLDRFLTTFDRSGFTKRGDMYYSSNYEAAAAKLNLEINAAFGDVNVEWVAR
jgi:hypothetical protein